MLRVSRGDRWLEFRLDRPAARNALSAEMVDTLCDEMQAAVAAGHCAALLSAEGPVFCAGGDVKEFRRPGVAPALQLLDYLRNVELYLCAIVEGPVLGAGCALVSLCPSVIATPESWFRLPEIESGTFPTPIVDYLDRAVHPRVSQDLAVTGQRMTAERARDVGLISSVHPALSARAAAEGLLDRLTTTSDAAQAARRAWQHRFG
jgi:enoyl-CoA hydratase/carnithine racemase